MTIGRRFIPIAAPEAPRCFSSRTQWVEYLCEAQKHPKPERRPFVGPELRYRPTFCYCRDCPALHRADMEDQGRCQFDSYVADRTAEQESVHATTV